MSRSIELPSKWDVSTKALAFALDRLKSPPDDQAAFEAVGSSLWWVVVVEEHVARSLEGDGVNYFKQVRTGDEGDLMRGLRYARNRAGHDPLIVIFVEPVPLYGAVYRAHYPATWCWRPLDGPDGLGPLPSKTPRRWREIEPCYEDLAGKPALDTLGVGRDFLFKVARHHNIR